MMQWTVSNQLTIGRVVLIPVFIAAFYVPGTPGHLLSGGLFIIAALTDWLDGHLARKRGEVTPLAVFLTRSPTSCW